MAINKPNERYCLGIESTADDFGVGVATFDGEILANAQTVTFLKQGAYILGKPRDTMLKSRTKS